MEFQNALVAVKKGYKIQRKSMRNRLNAVCIYLEGDCLMTKQTHELSEHRNIPLISLSSKNIMAKDWMAFK